MKKLFRFLCFTLLLAGCNQIESILYSPRQTPQDWLSIQPVMEIQIGSRAILIIQPTTSIIVYLLGFITIAAGIYFFSIKNSQQSRAWWGIALLLWGIGALLAGTSYEAFSYHIKCAGREFCLWTSWWEIIYLIVSAASIDAMMIAQAYSCTIRKQRKTLILLALTSITLYFLIILIGAFIPIQFLISFELLLIFSTPKIVFFIILNSRRYSQYRLVMDRALLGTWAWLAITIAGYFLYLLSDLTQRLWKQGVWFSENDVLHIGLILWMVYIVLVLAKHIKDIKPA